jgi:hypothetical protein
MSLRLVSCRFRYGLAARKGQGRQARPGDRGPHLQPARLRPHDGAGEADRSGGPEGDAVSERDEPLRQDDRLLRGHRSCGADAASAGEREPRPLTAPQVRDADHGRQPGGEGGTRQLHPPRRALPRDRHDLEAHDDGCKLQDLQGHRPRPDDPLDDGVQADHRARDADRGGLREAVLHNPRFPEGHRTVCRLRLRWRSRPNL